MKYLCPLEKGSLLAPPAATRILPAPLSFSPTVYLE